MEILILLLGVLGFVVAVWSLVLITKGILSITSELDNPALESKIGKVWVRTYSPAIAYVILGAGIVVASIYLSSRAPIRLKGYVHEDLRDISIELVIQERWTLEHIMSSGEIDETINPNRIQKVDVRVIVPGASPELVDRFNPGLTLFRKRIEITPDRLKNKRVVSNPEEIETQIEISDISEFVPYTGATLFY